MRQIPKPRPGEYPPYAAMYIDAALYPSPQKE
jgi:hypothetical protein